VKTPAVVAVVGAPEAFADLVRAAAERGARVGWLDWNAAAGPPAELGGAAGAGVAKVVSVAADGSLAWKARRGPAVLRDVLREQFLGCSIVLARGLDGTPRLIADGPTFRLEATGAAPRTLSAAEAAAELLRPRWRA